MNHLNCFVIQAMAGALHRRYTGKVLQDGFSNSPEHLVLDFGGGSFDSLYYRSEVFFSFEDHAASKSRLFKPQFTELHGLSLKRVYAHRYERSFAMEFENGFTLLFVCHGRKSNTILFGANRNLDMFRNMHSTDSALQLEDFKDRTIPPEWFADTGRLKTECPFLPEECFYKDVTDVKACIEQFEHIDGFDTAPDGKSLMPVFGRHTVAEDLSRFTRTYLRDIRFRDTSAELRASAEKSIREKEAFIQVNRDALKAIENKRSDEETGNCILAGMHAIPPGASKAVITDIYRNTPIEVKLDPKLNAVENAEKYFRKAKGIPHSIRLLKDKIAAAEKTLKHKQEILQTILKAESWKDLKPLLKDTVKKDIADELPYKRFVVQGFEILVGKHAESNEKLLNYYSDKDDVWMHAKDVSGSHVLLKSRRLPKLPDNVMEAAASLAAYYSRNRKQGLVTVTWTRRKFVRKIKGADKGKVSLSHEATLLVKPCIPDQA